MLYSTSNFTEVCSWGFNWEQEGIASGDGAVLNRWQVITWSIDDIVHWHINIMKPYWVNPKFSANMVQLAILLPFPDKVIGDKMATIDKYLP